VKTLPTKIVFLTCVSKLPLLII